MIATFKQLGYLGELGNQMFQISAVIGYANRHKKLPRFPIWTCKISGNDYSQGIFKNNLPLLTEDEGYLPYTNFNYQGLSYQNLSYVDGNINLIGYYQSEKYFLECKDIIREIFSPADSVKKYIDEKYKDILSIENKVALQIRTGCRNSNDYDVHAYATKEFIEKSQKNYDLDSIFIVFTDNITRAKEIIPIDKNYIFIENEPNYIDLFLMNRFDNYIVSASTFGWWGAWLSQNPSPKVSIMKDWFAVGKAKEYLNYNNDQIPDSWIKISQ